MNSAYPISNQRRAEILHRIQADRANKTQHLADMQKRQKIGLEIAQQAATILKEKFQVTRVVLFGSLLTPEKMHERSDIDIAVWGLADDQLLNAWSTLDGQITDPSNFPYIDLVPVEKTFPYMRESIEKQSIEL